MSARGDGPRDFQIWERWVGAHFEEHIIANDAVFTANQVDLSLKISDIWTFLGFPPAEEYNSGQLPGNI